MIRFRAALLAGLCLLAACKEEKKEAAGAAQDRATRAQRVAEERLLATLKRPGVQIRGVQSWSQAIANTYAVCGQVNAGGADRPFIPFVSVVTFAEGKDDPAVEQFVAMSSAEATRVYVEMTSRCGEEGGPRQSGNRIIPAPLPAVPDNLPHAGLPAAMPAPARPAAQSGAQAGAQPNGAAGQAAARAEPPPVAATPASGTVVMRQNGNLRANPHGGGEVLRVLPRGATLRVFGEAPGGWYQVGEGNAPAGWIHGSMLNR